MRIKTKNNVTLSLISVLLLVFIFSCKPNKTETVGIEINQELFPQQEEKPEMPRQAITLLPDTIKADNCYTQVSRFYSDFWHDSESDDAGGFAWIEFTKWSSNFVSATCQQRYGTEGNTFPIQPIRNLTIDSRGNLSFNVKWFQGHYGSDTLNYIDAKAKGTITLDMLKFTIDNEEDQREYELPIYSID